MTPYEHAKAYAANGFCVIPIRLCRTDERGKEPAIPVVKPYQTIKPTEEEMRRWWDNSNPCGLAILHGSISGFSEMLEAESLEDLEEFKQRLESHGLNRILEKLTLQVASPGGGVHFIYRCPELGSLEETPRSKRLAARYLLDDFGNRLLNINEETGEIGQGYRIKPKIETRAQAGYAIVPGSPLEVHPSRKPYALISGSFDAVPEITLEERKALFDTAQKCDAIDKKPKREKTSTPTVYSEHQGERAGEHYDRVATAEMVLDLLEDMGATGIAYKDHYLVARPGKSLREGHSAELFGGGNGLWVYSTSWGEFEPGTLYSPFGVYAIAKHGGDFKAAAKDLGLQGYGFNPGEAITKDLTTKQKPQSELDLDFPEKPIPDLTVQNQTDTGNAERLVAMHGGDIAYALGVGWMVWNNLHWINQGNDSLQITEMVKSTMAETKKQAYALGSVATDEAGHKVITKLVNHALSSENAGKIESAIKLARSIPRVNVTPSRFEPKPWLVPCLNGVWDRGEWKDGHVRERYIEHLLPVDYDPEADRTEWYALLERITGGDKDLELSLGELSATVLAGAALRKIIIFYGEPGTGKSTIAEMLTTVLGKCGATIEADYIVDPKKDSRLGSLIRGRRGLFIAEAGKRPFDTQFLKILSGGDTMTVRPLYTDYQLEFPCNWNIVMTSNDAPRIDSYDEGLRQRLVAVPFLHRLDAGENLIFTGHKRIEDARKDTNSPLLRGFFAWLIEGLNRLFLQDKNEPYLAPLVSEHTAKLLRDADPLTDFWDLYEAQNKLALSEGVQAADLHRSYSYWCETEKVRHIKRGKAFAAACRARGLVGHRTTHGVIWKKECRNVGKDPVLKSFPEIISHEDFSEKPTFLHSYIDSSSEDDLEQEEFELIPDGEEL